MGFGREEDRDSGTKKDIGEVDELDESIIDGEKNGS